MSKPAANRRSNSDPRLTAGTAAPPVTQQQMLAEVSELTKEEKLTAAAAAEVRQVIEGNVGQDGKVASGHKVINYWQTNDLVRRRLKSNKDNSEPTNWELVILVLIDEKATAWNKSRQKYGSTDSNCRNEKKMSAAAARETMPKVIAVFRSPLKNKSNRWKALFAIMRQLNNSGLYTEMEDQGLIT